jgi:hypothetical protein
MLALAVVGAFASVGAAAFVGGRMALATMVAAELFLLCAWKPATGTYVYIATLPFLVGLGRDRIIPFFRPNEALLLLVIAGALTGAYLRYVNGRSFYVRLTPVDTPLAVFVVLSTVWPLTSMLIRSEVPAGSDIAAVLPICKLAGLLLLVRTTIRTESQRLVCIRLIAWTAFVVAVIAFLQTRGVGPVTAFLDTFYAAEGTPASTERGSATLGHPIAVGDYIVIGLALVIASGVRHLLRRWEQILLGVVLAAGVLGTGQFSTWLGVLVAGTAVLSRYPALRQRAVRFLPAVLLVLVLAAPTVANRLEGFGGERGLPLSWLTRWDNVAHLYWPQIAEGGFLIGISPNSVLVPPDTWREQIYLESGYLQLLWVGGIPLVIAFGWLAVALRRHCQRTAGMPGAVGACGSALEAAWWMVLILSLIDIHLLLRGSGDLIFMLIAIATAARTEGTSITHAALRQSHVLR